ncbi:hypothetical protein [Delftia phage PhiW-14]|uniref:Uncharacterized protein n=1 Tax=Delftia phage PhiW-14 TaxID=665032 RepID=C9DGH7_BPW14|nr:MazG-like pyrophosphatase [Delftia phage PhiW-14]ACV50228.1 hypothetical protein [Delftia phage PhiW-14]
MKHLNLAIASVLTYNAQNIHAVGDRFTVALHIEAPAKGSDKGYVYFGVAARAKGDKQDQQTGKDLALLRLENALKNVDPDNFDEDDMVINGLCGRMVWAPYDSATNSVLARLDPAQVPMDGLLADSSPVRPFDGFFPVLEYANEAVGVWKERTGERTALLPPAIKVADNSVFDVARAVGNVERALGNHPLSTSPERLDEFWGTMLNQAKINLEEAKEIVEACEERDMKKLKDGVGDNLYTVLGTAHKAKLKVYSILREVNESNMSKLDTNEAEAQATAEHYAAMGVKVRVEPSPRQGYFITRVTEDCTDNKGKFYPKGKYLKSQSRFHEPEFLCTPVTL